MKSLGGSSQQRNDKGLSTIYGSARVSRGSAGAAPTRSAACVLLRQNPTAHRSQDVDCRISGERHWPMPSEFQLASGGAGGGFTVFKRPEIVLELLQPRIHTDRAAGHHFHYCSPGRIPSLKWSMSPHPDPLPALYVRASLQQRGERAEWRLVAVSAFSKRLADGSARAGKLYKCGRGACADEK